MRKGINLYLATLLALAACSVSAQTVTYGDLVKKLTDLEGLSVLPVQGEMCAQWSSYDRASKFDAATGKYIDWDANGDGGGIIRTEGDKVVMAEMEGPGCIWRIWSAAPGNGHVRIYIDGNAEPAVDLPFSQYFDGNHSPFIYPALVHNASSGQNAYVPIPYQKSCKIVADKDWGAYYHFTYATYPKSVVVPTFKRFMSTEDRWALAMADDMLGKRVGDDPAEERSNAATERVAASIKPGKTITAARLTGPAAITSIHAKVDLPTRKDEVTALRELVLKITFDGEKTPAVWAPLGDFFGTAPGVNLYRSLPLGMTDDGFYCYWYMPFAKNAKVEIVNEGRTARSVSLSIVHAPLTKPIAELGRFHAKWHRDAFPPTDPGRNIEWTMLKTSGMGRYCGVNLHVWNPKGGWWGEGDEMFYVDGEKFPSTFGTGSEDFFGYAWCNPTPFVNAYHDQPFNSGNNRGHASVNRWNITDNVPFHTGFVGTIEKYFPNDRPTLYACTTYWYQSPDGVDPYGSTPVGQRLGYFDIEMPAPAAVRGAIEGETMKIVSVTGGGAVPQDLTNFGENWSRGTHLWWTDGKPGSKLTLELPVRAAGKYSVKAQLTKAPDYGIVQLWMDDNKLGGPIDLYATSVVPTGEIDLGVADLSDGPHRLVAEIVGANDKAVKAYMFGLDYVKLDVVK